MTGCRCEVQWDVASSGAHLRECEDARDTELTPIYGELVGVGRRPGDRERPLLSVDLYGESGWTIGVLRARPTGKPEGFAGRGLCSAEASVFHTCSEGQ